MLVQGNFPEKGIGLPGGPGERMEQFAALKESRDQGALLRGTMNGREQLEQLFFVFLIFLESVFKREVLRLALSAETRRVRGEEGEGIIGFLALHEVEEHPSDQVHVGAVLSYELLDRPLVLRDLPAELGVEPLPEVIQHHPAQIFAAGHQGHGCERVVPFLVADPDGDLMSDGFELGGMAELAGKKTAEPA